MVSSLFCKILSTQFIFHLFRREDKLFCNAEKKQEEKKIYKDREKKKKKYLFGCVVL